MAAATHLPQSIAPSGRNGCCVLCTVKQQGRHGKDIWGDEGRKIHENVNKCCPSFGALEVGDWQETRSHDQLYPDALGNVLCNVDDIESESERTTCTEVTYF